MHIDFEYLNEFEISSTTSIEINKLLKICFQDTGYKDRDYFKQLPHYRILARSKGVLAGHLGIDFRVMRLNENAVNVFGIIDLCIDPTFRGKGISKMLVKEYESIAFNNRDRIDFLFLVTDNPNYYTSMGYTITNLETTWLKIDQHVNYGIGIENIEDAYFMIKSVSGKKWADGKLDMLGYMY
ncbi:GNAT family N-acetyltransferase [bacterium]|nr:GNAT family N-acetyltransferase [bacterium]